MLRSLKVAIYVFYSEEVKGAALSIRDLVADWIEDDGVIALTLREAEATGLEDIGLDREDIKGLTHATDVANHFSTSLGLGADTIDQARRGLNHLGSDATYVFFLIFDAAVDFMAGTVTLVQFTVLFIFAVYVLIFGFPPAFLTYSAVRSKPISVAPCYNTQSNEGGQSTR